MARTGWRVALGALALAAVAAALTALAGAGGPARPAPAAPPVMLWAWERPEDLGWIDPARVGVAFLARTIWIEQAGVRVRPRQQPLRVPAGARLMAVVRIESGGAAADLAPPRRAEAAAAAAAAWRPGLAGLQIDFDAAASEQPFYAHLLADVRAALPPGALLSMTALASWCLEGGWIDGLPVDEAVPMLFRMGPDGPSVRRRLDAGLAFRAVRCRGPVGVSTDEPRPPRWLSRRAYIFRPKAWTPDAWRAVMREVGRDGS